MELDAGRDSRWPPGSISTNRSAEADLLLAEETRADFEGTGRADGTDTVSAGLLRFEARLNIHQMLKPRTTTATTSNNLPAGLLSTLYIPAATTKMTMTSSSKPVEPAERRRRYDLRIAKIQLRRSRGSQNSIERR